MKNCSSYYSDTCCSVYSNEFMNSSGCTYYPTRQQRRRARKNHGQQGRSMVEMLGVLAIVGVLSIGGIAGYRYAMNKYYANEILNGVSKRAVIAMAQLAQGKEVNQISLSEFEDEEINGAQFSDSAVESPYAGEFGIAVTGVKETVCQNLIDMADDRITITESTDLQNPITEDECSDSNSLAFLFDSDTMMNSATISVYYSCESTDAAMSETGSYYRCSDYTEYSYCVGSGGYYANGSEAAKALCGSTYYGSAYFYCQSGRVWNDYGQEVECWGDDVCVGSGGYYANSSEAMWDLCGSNNYNSTYYYCQSGRIINGGSIVTDGCTCRKRSETYPDGTPLQVIWADMCSDGFCFDCVNGNIGDYYAGSVFARCSDYGYADVCRISNLDYEFCFNELSEAAQTLCEKI